MQDHVKGAYKRYRIPRLFCDSHIINVIFPGMYGIPEWVSHKSVGREIRIELPNNWYEADNNFLGFAIFFYLLPLDVDSPISKKIYSESRIQFGISNGDEFEYNDINFIFKGETKILRDENFMSSSLDPALRVVYIPHIAIARVSRSNGWNKIKVCFEGPFRCGNTIAFKVQSCGIHLINHDDAPMSSSSTKPSTI